MALPLRALAELARPLEELQQVLAARPTSGSHTLPIPAHAWRTHTDTLNEYLAGLHELLEQGPKEMDRFESVREWVAAIVETRTRLEAHAASMSPFAAFEPTNILPTLEHIDEVLDDATKALKGGHALVTARRQLPTLEPINPCAAMGVGIAHVFGMQDDPLDEHGAFRADKVFETYQYRGGDLMKVIAPHLTSLGLHFAIDQLAAVCIVAWIVLTPDPIVATTAMRECFRGAAHASSSVLGGVLARDPHLDSAERQTRRRMMTALSEVTAPEFDEDAALQLADAYRRLVEGPVRQKCWALVSLHRNSTEPTPTLAPVRDAMVAVGGPARFVAVHALLTDLRNATAHETLAWDGAAQTYVLPGSTRSPNEVMSAVTLSLSFERGIEAGLTYLRAIRAVADGSLPRVDEENRLPAWQRAEAFFGTNGLRLVSADLNGATGRVNLELLTESDINPLFQALLSVRRLVPKIDAFEIRVDGATRFEVDSSALDHTMPIWQHAIPTFDAMPFSTFLPVNLATRAKFETSSLASRSAAWIALDDVLDALDGGPSHLSENELALLAARFDLAFRALTACTPLIAADSATRITAASDAIERTIARLESIENSIAAEDIDEWPEIARIRHFWAAWGSVPPLPIELDSPARSQRTGSRRPQFRGLAGPAPWQLI